MQIYEYKIPMPDIGYNANAYLIKHKNKKSILVDAGPNSPQALDALEATLKKAEVGWDNIEHILVTHGHYDHFGFVAQIAERSGALVWVHPADRNKLTSALKNPFFIDPEAAIPFLEELGIQRTKIAGLINEVVTLEGGTKPLPESSIRSLSQGAVLNLSGLTIKVIHTPGHTPGSCCFQLVENGAVFTGDTLLPEIIPNPIFDLEGEERDLSLVRLQESMTKIRLLRASKAYPGHGKPILSIDSAIDRQFTHMAKRSEQVLGILGVYGLSTFSVTNKLFPSDGGRYHTWLALSVTLGHLGWLRVRNCVRTRRNAGIVYWEAQ
ncbi:MBL fold metallo-hydrolase [Desulfosporosinus nitroreducens]|uniref:MBL fold metallo-hydrolase n=1 Tax=Desulfosporosinus nitroreducens TaxID=2018668 RepID=A0ABT8QQ99_9FIRM|nr:MBL fold metallo-hydrolase [Desulfosporosinus nitroreducens]MDO0823022.1 MBL fold metallo-hydrolase [Desulfosporosinus nitroreducens]